MDALRIGFGVIWAIDAALKWLPGFRDSFGQTMNGLADGQPGWLKPWFDLWGGMGHTEALGLAYLIALTETYIALAVISGFARKATYLGAAIYSLMIWAIPEAFGGPYTSGATDIGTGIIYTVVFIGFLILSANTGPDRYSVDHYLELRIPWWWRVAEMRRPDSAVLDLRADDKSERRPTSYISVGQRQDA
jgi:nitrite reductase (NO-forming)